uniref:Malonyl-CoA decarboxylase n=1 Tax=Rhizophora mucronata TaxID=61149 RepID=A0A2P2LMP7_RHIMU
MNKKGLAILLRARMRPADPTRTSSISISPLTNGVNQMVANSQAGHVSGHPSAQGSNNFNGSTFKERDFDLVQESMHSAISMNKTEVLDGVLDDFSEGYFSLSCENRRKLLLVLAKEYDLNRIQVRELMKQYLGLQLPSSEICNDMFYCLSMTRYS